jgi:hypothetical protein
MLLNIALLFLGAALNNFHQFLFNNVKPSGSSHLFGDANTSFYPEISDIT